MSFPPVQPSWAERARTRLADARMATLFVRGRSVDATQTVVALEEQIGGRPLIVLERESPTVKQLLQCPVATLSVPGPEPYSCLQLVGTFRPVRIEVEALCGFRPTVLSVHLQGSARRSIAVEDFLRAEPDPLRGDVAATLRHLEHAHAGDLLACVRSQGFEALAVVPTGVDRYGLELASIRADGVQQLRLTFPGGPVTSMSELHAGFGMMICCGCAKGGRPSR